jgi:hypothetical protein
MPRRSIVHRYEDPVDLIWLRAAADLGLDVQRSTDAYAAYDGKGTLTISVAEEFDPDDSLAQMIYHEICLLVCRFLFFLVSSIPTPFAEVDCYLSTVTAAAAR